MEGNAQNDSSITDANAGQDDPSSEVDTIRNIDGRQLKFNYILVIVLIFLIPPSQLLCFLNTPFVGAFRIRAMRFQSCIWIQSCEMKIRQKHCGLANEITGSMVHEIRICAIVYLFGYRFLT
ncbi:WPP domain-interacting tail-anchored protein 1-like [Salvia divinorum]|uniref:WPP domain-interacting tail-anchored protein 1-like n=1 Tax=Salvia divinorum TaxID=28513 RepID=A0ABD1G3W9_SALDI